MNQCRTFAKVPSGTTVSRLSRFRHVVTLEPRHAPSHGIDTTPLCTRKSSWITTSAVSYERARSTDRLSILNLILQEKMNPLGVVVFIEENFIVARGQDSSTILGAGQLKSLDTCSFELSSCVVAPGARGRGIGSGIVRALLDRAPLNSRIYLVTVEDREEFYSRFGFRIVREDIPLSLQMEVVVGTCIARFVTGLGLIVMCVDTNDLQ